MKTMGENNHVIITANWPEANSVSLSAAVTLADCKRNETELLDDISAETCVLLRSTEPESDIADLPRSPLTLDLEVRQTAPVLISALSIICEARHLEIYNRRGQYISTVRTKLLDKLDDDFVAYESDVHLDSPLDYISIKFLSLRSRDEMWLYGIKVETVESNEDRTNTSTAAVQGSKFDVGPMIAKLESDGVLLSDNAKRFACLMQAGSHGADTNLASAANWMALLAQRMPQLANIKKESPANQNGSNEETNTPPNFDYNLEQQLRDIERRMVAHLNTSLECMENRLWSRIDTRLASLEECHEAQFDRILKAVQTTLKIRNEKDLAKHD